MYEGGETGESNRKGSEEIMLPSSKYESPITPPHRVHGPERSEMGSAPNVSSSLTVDVFGGSEVGEVGEVGLHNVDLSIDGLNFDSGR